MSTPCYALYRGDRFIDLGSIAYLAKRMGVSEATIRYYGSPTYRKRGSYENRLLLIRIEN